jgi:hypothetical protein
MQPLRFPVEVVIERVALVNRWADELWRPVAVALQDASATAPAGPCVEAHDASATRWRLPGHAFELHPVEAEGYFLNVTSPAPCVFVMWRMFEDGAPPARPVLVTVSYNEAGRLLDAGERVDNVPMAPAILALTRAFVAANYRPEPRKKLRRNDPFADGALPRERGPGR